MTIFGKHNKQAHLICYLLIFSLVIFLIAIAWTGEALKKKKTTLKIEVVTHLAIQNTTPESTGYYFSSVCIHLQARCQIRNQEEINNHHKMFQTLCVQ